MINVSNDRKVYREYLLLEIEIGKEFSKKLPIIVTLTVNHITGHYVEVKFQT